MVEYEFPSPLVLWPVPPEPPGWPRWPWEWLAVAVAVLVWFPIP